MRLKFLEHIQSIGNALFVYTLCAIISTSLVHQYLRIDFPCDLCLLQRVAFLGTAIGLLLNLLYGIKVEHYALSMANALLGFLASLYQISLHLDADVALDTVPFFGHYLFIWSFFTFLVSLVALTILLFLQGVLTKSKPLAQTWVTPAMIWVGVLAIFCFITSFAY